MNNPKDDTDRELEGLNPSIAQIIGFATSEAVEAGRSFSGTWGNSELIQKYGWQVQALIDRKCRAARIEEAGLWMQMVTRNDTSRLDTNEWYKLNPQVVAKFWAERQSKLQSQDSASGERCFYCGATGDEPHRGSHE